MSVHADPQAIRLAPSITLSWGEVAGLCDEILRVEANLCRAGRPREAERLGLVVDRLEGQLALQSTPAGPT